MSKIVFLTQYFYPELISTGQLLTELAEDLVVNGIDVVALTGQPTYYSNEKVNKKIIYKGISIYRNFNTQFNKNGFIGKVSNSISFFISTLIRVLVSQNKTPLLIVTNPPLLPFIGFIAKKLKGRKFILLMHDVYPDIAVKLGHFKSGGLFDLCLTWTYNQIFRAADRIIVLGRDMEEVVKSKLIEKKIGIEKINIIPNWSDGELIKDIDKSKNIFARKYGFDNKFIIQYSGNMGLSHDVESIIEAARSLKENKDIIFLFIGGGGKKEKLQDMVKEYQLRNVIFHPYQPRAMLGMTLTCSDVSIVSLKSELLGLSVPSKFYGIIASARPVIALVPANSEVALAVNESGCGFVIEPKDVSKLVNCIQLLYKNRKKCKEFSTNARNYFDNNYTRTKIAKRYMKLIQEVSI